MGKTYIFAIGGTGARVVRSLTMLMASGIPGFNHDTEICPIIIDYDLHNGDKDRAVNSMKKYCKVRELIEKGEHKRDNEFFSAKITDMTTNKGNAFQWYFDIQKNADQKYSEYIEYSNMEKKTPVTKKTVDGLYDTTNDPEYTELYLNMKVGFQGNPNIGSVVLNRLKDDEEFRNFQTYFNPNEDRVVIIGSLFGGTGASGIPELITAIHNEKANTNLRKANIAAVMILPYFKVKREGDSEGTIKSRIFNSKTKAALNYYESSGLNNLINSIYYVGDRTPTVVQYSIGASDQKNNAHPVEMIAAMAVAHFVNADIDKNEYKNAVRRRYKFNVGGEIGQGGITFRTLVGNNAEADPFVKDIMHNMINFNLMMKYFVDKVYSNSPDKRASWYYKERLKLSEIEDKKTPSDDGKYYLKDFLAALYRFYCKELNQNDENDDGYMPWIKELQARHEGHGLHLFNFGTDKIECFIPECEFVVVQKTYLGIGRGKTPLLTYQTTFDSCLDNAIKVPKYWEKEAGEASAEQYPYILVDIMGRAAEDIHTFDDKLKDKFNQLP